MSKISLNILPGLRKWFVEKTSILTAWNTTASDSQIPSEKLVKTELDKILFFLSLFLNRGVNLWLNHSKQTY